jgi:diketogulonate reductase-like aldo/keto reductase
MAYSPFGSGDFPAPSSAPGRALAAVARARGATPHQIALAYLARRPLVFVIPKAGSAAHAVENARAAEIALTAEEVAQIEAAFPLGPPGPLPTL